MYKIALITLGILFAVLVAFSNTVKAEEIHFNNNVFILKYSTLSPANKGYENEYFLTNETRKDWTKMVGIYYYPEISNPIKYADSETKKIESKDINVLLKLIQNKKTDKAALSYLQNGFVEGKKYFEYNILRYEKHPAKGMIALRYAIRYFFNTDEEIKTIGKKVREQNDEYLEKIITSPMPQIVEKEINE